MSGEAERSELDRIERVYAGYSQDPRVRRRWSADNRGNALIERERDRAVQTALSRVDLWPPVGVRMLDLGCGDGHVLRRFRRWGARSGDLVGVDLLGERLLQGRRADPDLSLVRASGTSLPFRDRSFRAVILFTVMSSVLDEPVAAQIAGEVDRVLETSGFVLWYDVRVRNPMNPNTRALTVDDVRRYFPGYRCELESITLLPLLARRLGPLTPIAYRVLSAVPSLRTHHVGLLRRPAS